MSIDSSEQRKNGAEAEDYTKAAALKGIEINRAYRKDAFDLSQDYLHGYACFPFDIDDGSVDGLLGLLRRMDRLNPAQPWTIELYSPGGDMVAGFRLYDELLRLKKNHPLTIRVRGEAASMAAVVLQAADVREVGPSSWIMLHRASLGVQSDADKAEDALKLVKRFEARVYDILEQRTGKPSAYWKRQLGQRKDEYYTAEQALSLGLVDAIA